MQHFLALTTALIPTNNFPAIGRVLSSTTSTKTSSVSKLISSSWLPREKEATEAAEVVFNWLSCLLSISAGLLIGLVVAFLINRIGALLARRHLLIRLLFRRINRPIYGCFALIGAYSGLSYTITEFTGVISPWLSHAQHLLLLCSIGCVTWLIASAIFLLEDVARAEVARRSKEKRNRMLTQAQIIRRVLQVVVVVFGVACGILTFPAAQVAMSSVLASAGVASIVATLAAQSTLANIFAGLQLAMSDAIRVGDIVQIPGLEGKKEQGHIEEITLTYVVIKLVDERRMIVPSNQFTQAKFENWTRKHTEQFGSVELFLDYSAPVAAIRSRVDYLLSLSELWDGRAGSVEVTNMSEQSMTVRILLSAANADDLFQLRCYIREELLGWLQQNHPWALVAKRVRQVETDRLEEGAALASARRLDTQIAKWQTHASVD